MGNKTGKSNKSKSDRDGKLSGNESRKASFISETDLIFLSNQTGMNKADIGNLFLQFKFNNPDGKLDKDEFVKLYSKLRPEPDEMLDEINRYVFKAFDTDKNGYLTFKEFVIAYAITSRGDVRSKLEYAFNLYDTDNNGFLDREEIKEVLTAMLDLLQADKSKNVLSALTEECINQLDANKDGKISKMEFVDGLQKNYSLRALMSPFN